MKAVLVNYNFDPTWLQNYDFDVTLYDRSDDGVERNLTSVARVLSTKNVGDVDYDKLGYLIEHYNNLPDVFLWGKTNLFKYVEQKDLDKALENPQFTPLLKFDHKIYGDKFGEVNKYQGNMYCERADSWFFNATASRHFKTWQEWCLHFGLPQQAFIPFAPGGNYILTREAVHKYGVDLYKEMRSFLDHSQRPAEAQACERSYYLLWK